MEQAATRVQGRSATASQTLAVLWLTYGAFYFCRANLAAAVPGIQAETGLSKEQIGTVLAALKLAYGVGQLINGQLAERISPRLLLTFGMFGSALLNGLFGLWAALEFMVFIWALNGYAQALGWPPCMRVTANWFPADVRGRAIGFLGTGYQLAGAVTVVIAGAAAERFGWRGALWLPSVLLATAGVVMLLFLRERPAEEVAAPSGDRERNALLPRPSFLAGLVDTLRNPALWLLAGSLCLLDAVRYGFLDWGLTHLKEVQGGGVDTNALKVAVIPLGGIPGAYLAGWVSDRWFHGRRAPVMVLLLLALGGLTLLYEGVARTSLAGTILLLALIGFTIFGPQVLLVGTAPVDLAARGNPAAAAGFVNFMGYMGAFAGDRVTGGLVDRHGWQTAVWVWAACAFGAALCAAPLWKTRAGEK